MNSRMELDIFLCKYEVNILCVQYVNVYSHCTQLLII